MEHLLTETVEEFQIVPCSVALAQLFRKLLCTVHVDSRHA